MLTKQEICDEFDISDFKGVIVHGEIDNGGYEGSAAIVFAEGGELKWVSGSHCSCYGFEGQWQPEVTTVETLQHIAAHGYGTEQKVANGALELLSKFGTPTDPDAIAAAITLYYGAHA
jgi:hypothetical protein